MISRLHYITQDLPDFSHPQLAELACKGGADWVQLRVKNRSHVEWLQITRETKLICLKYGARLIINDSVQIAKEVGAHGVHLGKEDMDPKEARKILGSNFIIGGSSNTIEDVKELMANGVDYIGIGPYRFTSTKEKLNPVLGLEGIGNIIRMMSSSGMGLGGGIPLIAIGGIRIEDIEPLMKTGIRGVAVSSAISLARDKSGVTKEFLEAIHREDAKAQRIQNLAS